MSVKKKFIPTKEQQKILDIKEGTHLVLAPPGSGKTELLATRVENAIKGGLKDNEIICLTFTNRAAKGMKERIECKYPNNVIIIGNIHHYCSTFLFKNKLIPLNTSILDEEDTDSLIDEIKKELKYSPTVNGKPFSVYNPNLLKLATYLRQQKLGFTQNLLQLPKLNELPDFEKAKQVAQAYIDMKTSYGFIDFDDLLTETYYNLLNKNADLINGSFKWIQVDEVQDLNPIQWAIIEQIKSIEGLTVYFGDYEQAIFSFMGAKLASLHAIEKICKSNPTNGIHNLQKNFRSPSYLLNIYVDYAKKLLNPTWKKEPIPSKIETPENGALKIHPIVGTIQNEAAYITNNIIPNIIESPNEKTAIIVRYNNTADIISSELSKKGISHFKISGFDLFRRKSIKGLMAFLSIFGNTFDKLSWVRIFYEFHAFRTLKESRLFIRNMFNAGFTPFDFLQLGKKSSRVKHFHEVINSKRVIVFDTETTGLNTTEDDIIQIAAIEVINGKLGREFEVYINTDKDLTESEQVHNISKEFLSKHGKSPETSFNEFITFIGSDSILIAHNLEFDINILDSNLKRYLSTTIKEISNCQIDTLGLAKLIYPNLTSYKLSHLIQYLGIVGINSHNALDDVKATASLVNVMLIDASTLIDKQNRFLEDPINLNGLDKFLEIFPRLYESVIVELNKVETLETLINKYFTYLLDIGIIDKNEFDNKEQKELKKLTSHINYYTKAGNDLSLKEKISKYIPEYNSFKESDLFYGEDKLVLSTVYKAKGLEFDNVIIAEATDSTYPSFASSTEEEIQEDARAFYVAMTRTKKRLHITNHDTFTSSWGNTYHRHPSRFISTIQHHFK